MKISYNQLWFVGYLFVCSTAATFGATIIKILHWLRNIIIFNQILKSIEETKEVTFQRRRLTE